MWSGALELDAQVLADHLARGQHRHLATLRDIHPSSREASFTRLSMGSSPPLMFSLWVRTATPERGRRAIEVLTRHAVHDVHVHEIPAPA
jgi:hypothetical protein